jgi:hypothetical protein
MSLLLLSHRPEQDTGLHQPPGEQQVSANLCLRRWREGCWPAALPRRKSVQGEDAWVEGWVRTKEMNHTPALLLPFPLPPCLLPGTPRSLPVINPTHEPWSQSSALADLGPVHTLNAVTEFCPLCFPTPAPAFHTSLFIYVYKNFLVFDNRIPPWLSFI